MSGPSQGTVEHGWQARHVAARRGAVNRSIRRLAVGMRAPAVAPSLLYGRPDLSARSRHAEDGAGEGNRTLVVSLEGFCSTIELHPPAL